ncbi:hypothetical protein MEN56_11220, partial [Staphylococcus aureus]|nr:hypothetical protein [Staphylococcus aureus]
MNYLSNFFNTTIQLNIYIIVIVAACYIAIHQYRHCLLYTSDAADEA